jgi:hypothetical protein
MTVLVAINIATGVVANVVGADRIGEASGRRLGHAIKPYSGTWTAIERWHCGDLELRLEKLVQKFYQE